MIEGEEGADQAEACQELIGHLSRVREGEESVELLLLDPMGHSQILSDQAKSAELSTEEIAALATGPQIPVFDARDLQE